ncbi:hypothetical protein BWQ96_09605 [Gracilariopsis chorda]|uniref:Uncharacterized protein n=1 Tax=Gracilariopsis chorda TaxID=448386 RepID=A0A2V3IF41_9FLOR|nr:hypothetical protein BWQ96_09605 [Gracilariopsis chorda]|eukprot:PXF40687.1 hypothetical protein BWQ96_09605 [Gracilariopsis chorda]
MKGLCVLLLVLLASQVSASRLHRVSNASGPPTVLRGHTLISGSTGVPTLSASSFNSFTSTPNAASLVHPTPRLLQFSVKLKKDSVLFDELEEDGVSISSCTRDAASLKETVQRTGDNLDYFDFAAGIAFVIDVDDWEKHCGQVQPVDGVDEADDALFYIVDVVSMSGRQAFLSMSIVPGSEVAPEIDIDISEERVLVSALPQKAVFNDSPLFASTSSLLATSRNVIPNGSLPSATRPTFSHKSKISRAPC